MSRGDLDDIDKGIIHLLQQNARSYTTTEIGEQVGVSASTVTNRIQRLEEGGVITGYHPIIDYQKAGLGHHLLAVATVPLEKQDDLVDDIMGVEGVVSVRELLSNHQNMAIELVGHTREDIEETLAGVNALDVDVVRMEIMKGEHTRPYNHFGTEQSTEGDGG